MQNKRTLVTNRIINTLIEDGVNSNPRFRDPEQALVADGDPGQVLENVLTRIQEALLDTQQFVRDEAGTIIAPALSVAIDEGLESGEAFGPRGILEWLRAL